MRTETGIFVKDTVVTASATKQYRGYGMIRWKQESMGFGDFALSFENPDFVKYAEAYGAKGARVGATDDLVPILDAADCRGHRRSVQPIQSRWGSPGCRAD